MDKTTPTGPVRYARERRQNPDGDELPLAGGLRVVHVPGHCAGQIALVWPHHGGVLLTADAANMALPGQPRRLGFPPEFEFGEGKRSLKRPAQLDMAVFGHGAPIVGGASERFQKRFGDV